MSKSKPEMLPANTFYVYTRRKTKDEYWRRGKVVMLPALMPVNGSKTARVAFFNTDIGKTFSPPKRYLKRAKLFEARG